MTIMQKISNYVTDDKFYKVYYNHEGYEGHVIGLLLNYNSGTIDLLSEDGIWHINYNDITFMHPVIKSGSFSQEFEDLLKEIM